MFDTVPRIGELLRSGTVNNKDSLGQSPIFSAAQRGDFRFVRTQSSDYICICFQSKISGEFEAVKVLLEHGADVNAENNEKWTPLHISSKNGNISKICNVLH